MAERGWMQYRCGHDERIREQQMRNPQAFDDSCWSEHVHDCCSAATERGANSDLPLHVVRQAGCALGIMLSSKHCEPFLKLLFSTEDLLLTHHSVDVEVQSSQLARAIQQLGVQGHQAGSCHLLYTLSISDAHISHTRRRNFDLAQELFPSFPWPNPSPARLPVHC